MVHRIIYNHQLGIDFGHIDLKTVRNMVSGHKTRIERQYLQYLDEAIPIQRCAKLVGRLFTARFDAILLHRHLNSRGNNKIQPDVRDT